MASAFVGLEPSVFPKAVVQNQREFLKLTISGHANDDVFVVLCYIDTVGRDVWVAVSHPLVLSCTVEPGAYDIAKREEIRFQKRRIEELPCICQLEQETYPVPSSPCG